MFPFSFEWGWDMSHFVFMGGLWYAIIILGLGVGCVATKSMWQSLKSDGGGHGHDEHH